MSDTPRTDRVAKDNYIDGWINQNFVSLDFARQLETELSVSQAREGKLREALEHIRANVPNTKVCFLSPYTKRDIWLGDFVLEALNQTQGGEPNKGGFNCKFASGCPDSFRCAQDGECLAEPATSPLTGGGDVQSEAAADISGICEVKMPKRPFNSTQKEPCKNLSADPSKTKAPTGLEATIARSSNTNQSEKLEPESDPPIVASEAPLVTSVFFGKPIATSETPETEEQMCRALTLVSRELFDTVVTERNALRTSLAQVEKELATSQAQNRWSHTCIHYTDAERAGAVGCPICMVREMDRLQARVVELEKELAGNKEANRGLYQSAMLAVKDERLARQRAESEIAALKEENSWLEQGGSV